MNKQEFLEQLRKGLNGLPKNDIEERITFYGEIIDDLVEEGSTEEDAVNGIGAVGELISQIISDTPHTRLVKQKITPKKRISVFEIVLLVLGSPLWVSLLIVFFSILTSIYVVVWSVIICLWSVFVSLAGVAIGGITAGVVFSLTGNSLSGIATIGVSVFCIGLSVFVFYGCKSITKYTVFLTKKMLLKIKNSFIKKEET